MKKFLKFIKKFLLLIFIIGIIGGGWFYYNKYKTEKLKKLAEEEKRKKEELEREKQRKLLEEKRKEFENLIVEMENFFKKGDYTKVKELSEKGFLLGKEYNFSVDKIKEILYKIEVNTYLSKLRKLQKENEDIYKFFYVRKEVMKIPSLKEIASLKKEILDKTFENEYKVKLLWAKNTLEKLEDEGIHNYFLSKKILDDAKKIRLARNIEKDKLEDQIEILQSEVYFALKQLHENTIPKSLY
ncbi:MAG: hypothetical protein NC922_02915 [Candidatus Omnitrophica bacterium]|nr:hypothetical protein [Candidatus Omnitrophota bacterium]